MVSFLLDYIIIFVWYWLFLVFACVCVCCWTTWCGWVVNLIDLSWQLFVIVFLFRSESVRVRVWNRENGHCVLFFFFFLVLWNKAAVFQVFPKSVASCVPSDQVWPILVSNRTSVKQFKSTVYGSVVSRKGIFGILLFRECDCVVLYHVLAICWCVCCYGSYCIR